MMQNLADWGQGRRGSGSTAEEASADDDDNAGVNKDVKAKGKDVGAAQRTDKQVKHLEQEVTDKQMSKLTKKIKDGKVSQKVMDRLNKWMLKHGKGSIKDLVSKEKSGAPKSRQLADGGQTMQDVLAASQAVRAMYTGLGVARGSGVNVVLLDSSLSNLPVTLARKATWRVVGGRQIYSPVTQANPVSGDDDDGQEFDARLSHGALDRLEDGGVLEDKLPTDSGVGLADWWKQAPAGFDKSRRLESVAAAPVAVRGAARRLQEVGDYGDDLAGLADEQQTAGFEDDGGFFGDYEDKYTGGDDLLGGGEGGEPKGEGEGDADAQQVWDDWYEEDFTGEASGPMMYDTQYDAMDDAYDSLQDDGYDDYAYFDTERAFGAVTGEGSESKRTSRSSIDAKKLILGKLVPFYRRHTVLAATKGDMAAALSRVLTNGKNVDASAMPAPPKADQGEWPQSRIGDECVMKRILFAFATRGYRIVRTVTPGLVVLDSTSGSLLAGGGANPETAPCDCEMNEVGGHCRIWLPLTSVDDPKDEERVNCALTQIIASMGLQLPARVETEEAKEERKKMNKAFIENVGAKKGALGGTPRALAASSSARRLAPDLETRVRFSDVVLATHTARFFDPSRGVEIVAKLAARPDALAETAEKDSKLKRFDGLPVEVFGFRFLLTNKAVPFEQQ